MSDFFTLFISASAVAGIAVIWRNWVEDHPHWKKYLQEKLGVFGKALLCGSCFTYWISLLFIFYRDPLTMWNVHIFFHWMALAWCGVFLRFAYVALQELVHYQVHHLREHNH